MLCPLCRLWRRFRPASATVMLSSHRTRYAREEVDAMLDGINEALKDGARLRPPPGEPDPERPAWRGFFVPEFPENAA